MADEGLALAFHLAWLVGVWHLVVAGWIVFFSRTHAALLTTTAVVKGLLGACIYLIVREPSWIFTPDAEVFLLPVTLVLLYVFSALVTALIWKAYNLVPPWTRARQLAQEIRH